MSRLRLRAWGPWLVVVVLIGAIASALGVGESPASDPQTLPSATRPAATPTTEAPSAPGDASPSAAPSISGTPPAPAPSATAAEPTVDDVWRDALETLESIPVKGRAPKTGYDRDGQFGDAWIDVDRNGCDTRNDILRRDLIEIVVDERCRVLTGTLLDPYTGATIAFVRGQSTSSAVQIDHVVALLNAWETGAQQLTADARLRFANDPRNLLAVDGRANAQKGAGDAATWLPPNRAFRCDYVARQVEVKAAYQLWVTAAERDAIERVLEGCL